MIKKTLGLFFGVVMLFIVYILLSAFITHAPRKRHVIKAFEYDTEAVQHLRQAIQFQTIASKPYYDAKIFFRFRQFLKSSYPLVFKHLDFSLIGADSLLLTWRGSNTNAPARIYMAHYDVVPIQEKTRQNWQYPPFSGFDDGRYIWGRGTLDDKHALIAILEAMQRLLKSGWQPDATVYFAFGADEETGGFAGNFLIANTLQSKSIAYVVDEGMPIIQGVIPGVEKPIAMVGVAEKGYMNVQLQSQTGGGHASVPDAENVIAVLSRAVLATETKTFATKWNAVLESMFSTLAPHMSYSYRLAFSHLWLTRPLIKTMLSENLTTRALLGTTSVATSFRSVSEENVQPSSGEVNLNLRIDITQSIDTTLAQLQQQIQRMPITITFDRATANNPIVIDDLNSEHLQRFLSVIKQVYPETIPSPAIMIATTDSRHYHGLTNQIFRFTPVKLQPDDIKRFHGVNERIEKQAFIREIQFYQKLLSQ